LISRRLSSCSLSYSYNLVKELTGVYVKYCIDGKECRVQTGYFIKGLVAGTPKATKVALCLYDKLFIRFRLSVKQSEGIDTEDCDILFTYGILILDIRDCVCDSAGLELESVCDIERKEDYLGRRFLCSKRNSQWVCLDRKYNSILKLSIENMQFMQEQYGNSFEDLISKVEYENLDAELSRLNLKSEF